MSVVIVLVILAYLIGSLSFAVLVSRVSGLADPRTYGSGNPGATNVLRTGNKKAAIATLAGDCFKGWFAVWLVMQLGSQFILNGAVSLMTLTALGALAVFCGHLWPVFFRFIGGKGVATALGVLLAIDWRLGVGTLVTWLVVAYAFRYSSLSALIAAIFAPFFYAFIYGINVLFGAICVMSLLLLWRHAKNIANLVSGREGRIGSRKKVVAE